jgi:DNA helicase-2/ATP-dependent DNA helicase PcrA
MDEGIFPSSMSMDTKKAIEEERRLLYVAITRAGKYCTLTSAKNRYRYGKQETFMPSRFISEIDHSLLRVSRSGDSLSFASERKSQRFDYGLENRFYQTQEKSRGERDTDSSVFASKPSYGTQYNNSSSAMRRLTRIPSGRSSSLPSASDSGSSFNVGDRVEHERFGVGHILSIDGTGENTKAQVEFSNVGRKQLLLKFARLKKV